ncbi:MAG: hypothetical protein ACOZCO_15405 [Bacteroidota bacterium]
MNTLKSALLLLFLVFSVASFAGPEYAVFRVEYSVKKAGFEATLTWEKPNSKTHSLAAVVESTESGGIKVTHKNGSIEVVHNEVDLLNALTEYGFKLQDSFTIKIMSNEYQTFIMVKE